MNFNYFVNKYLNCIFVINDTFVFRFNVVSPATTLLKLPWLGLVDIFSIKKVRLDWKNTPNSNQSNLCKPLNSSSL